MPSLTVEFRYLQVVTNALAGDRATVGLVHWDGASLRVTFSTAAVRSLDTYDDIEHSVRALERRFERQVRHINPAPTLFKQTLGELVGDVPTRAGDTLVWSRVHTGFARDVEGHFAELRTRLGLAPKLPRGRHAFTRALRNALEDLAVDLQPKWGDDAVKSANKVRSHYEFTAPISWKNGAWNHAVPVSLDVDGPADLQANVRDAISRVLTSVPTADTPVLVAVLPNSPTKGPMAEQEAHYMRDAIPRARLSTVRLRPETGTLDVDPVRQLVEHDVSHGTRVHVPH